MKTPRRDASKPPTKKKSMTKTQLQKRAILATEERERKDRRRHRYDTRVMHAKD